jgi:hypothetical protein
MKKSNLIKEMVYVFSVIVVIAFAFYLTSRISYKKGLQDKDCGLKLENICDELNVSSYGDGWVKFGCTIKGK